MLAKIDNRCFYLNSTLMSISRVIDFFSVINLKIKQYFLKSEQNSQIETHFFLNLKSFFKADPNSNFLDIVDQTH